NAADRANRAGVVEELKADQLLHVFPIHEEHGAVEAQLAVEQVELQAGLVVPEDLGLELVAQVDVVAGLRTTRLEAARGGRVGEHVRRRLPAEREARREIVE